MKATNRKARTLVRKPGLLAKTAEPVVKVRKVIAEATKPPAQSQGLNAGVREQSQWFTLPTTRGPRYFAPVVTRAFDDIAAAKQRAKHDQHGAGQSEYSAALPGVELLDLALTMPDGMGRDGAELLGELRIVAQRGGAEELFASLCRFVEAVAEHGVHAVRESLDKLGSVTSDGKATVSA
jgi:hypothetical protein